MDPAIVEKSSTHRQLTMGILSRGIALTNPRTRFTMTLSPPVESGLVTNCNCELRVITLSPPIASLWCTLYNHTLADLRSPNSGSICTTNGYLMVYPLESNITWASGFDTMTTYTFGPERIAHSFCSTCGTSMCAKSTDPNFFANNRAMNVSQPRPLLRDLSVGK